MRWNEIVTEGSDYNCPDCGEYLGKTSEVIANHGEYCGNCGWEAKPLKTKKPARKMREAMGDLMIFGRTVPNWDHEDEREDAAMFSSDPMYQPAQVLYRNGRWEVWFSTEEHESFKTNTQLEQFLKKRGYTEFDGWETFSPQTPPGVDD